MKIEHVLFPFVFSNLRIRVLEGHFHCVHTIRFPEPTKIGSLKTDRVNGPLQLRTKGAIHHTTHHSYPLREMIVRNGLPEMSVRSGSL